MEGVKVDYKDDACWELFPGVGEAVRSVTGSEEPLRRGATRPRLCFRRPRLKRVLSPTGT